MKHYRGRISKPITVRFGASGSGRILRPQGWLIRRRITHDVRGSAFHFKEDPTDVRSDDAETQKLYGTREEDDDGGAGPAGWGGTVQPGAGEQPDEEENRQG